jgi:hypothetical protein
VRSELAWNMDEMGHADWPDGHSDIVFVPPDCAGARGPIGVSRTSKRSH